MDLTKVIDDRTYFSISRWALLPILLFSTCFIACLAQVRIPLPYTPVPITGHSFAIMVIVGLFGTKNATYTVVIYLFEVIMGLPVLSGGGSGWFSLVGPTGGYIIGFIFQAYCTGIMIEKIKDYTYWKLFLAFAVGSCILLLVGTLYLSFFIGKNDAIACGFLPFIPGDMLKSLIAAYIFSRVYRFRTP